MLFRSDIDVAPFIAVAQWTRGDACPLVLDEVEVPSASCVELGCEWHILDLPARGLAYGSCYCGNGGFGGLSGRDRLGRGGMRDRVHDGGGEE